ncbi:voltage-gated hydrogen channel 1-like isoform X3 [Dipodomys merriami]|uniref:voltage-gated hydrogen channel 1-like isoform X1 n=1 Tax=Dipodomys merriami TaxID=94247 RepID=UPI003855E83C
MQAQDKKAARARARARAPRPAMGRLLRHFTVVGDDYRAWNVNYQRWENEAEEEEPPEPEPEPGPAEEGRAAAPKPGSAPAPAPAAPRDLRSALRRLFISHRFQVVVICLVILDALLVLAELLLDLKIIQADKNNYAPWVFHYMSIAILFLFMVEVFLKIFVFHLEFFHHKFEILDTIVVVVSFVLDIVLLFREHEFEALGLLILLRLWRVARIINGASHARGLRWDRARLVTRGSQVCGTRRGDPWPPPAWPHLTQHCARHLHRSRSHGRCRSAACACGLS